MDSSGNRVNPNYKTKEDKQKEIINIMRQLGHLEIGVSHPSIKQFYQTCSSYIEGSKSLDGRVNLEGLGRILIYNLPQKKGREVELTLRFHKNL